MARSGITALIRNTWWKRAGGKRRPFQRDEAEEHRSHRHAEADTELPAARRRGWWRIITALIELTKVSDPETIGLTPNPTCNISGRRKGTPLRPNRHGERQDVGGDREIHPKRRGWEALCHRWHRRHHDGGVELVDQERDGDDARDDQAEARVPLDRKAAYRRSACRFLRRCGRVVGVM